MPTIDQARAFYTGADPVHDFDHILRVLAMAERLARAEGADLEIVRAAALLHDASGSRPGAQLENGDASRVTHHLASAEFARQVLSEEGWPKDRVEAVLHCIRAHRFRDNSEPPQTLEAKVIFDADKLDVLGAIGAMRCVAYAALDGQPLHAEPSPRFLASGEPEPGEPHSPYHEFLFKLSKIKDRMHTPTAQRIAQERHRYLEAFYEQLRREVRGEA